MIEKKDSGNNFLAIWVHKQEKNKQTNKNCNENDSIKNIFLLLYWFRANKDIMKVCWWYLRWRCRKHRFGSIFIMRIYIYIYIYTYKKILEIITLQYEFTSKKRTKNKTKVQLKWQHKKHFSSFVLI